MPKSITSTHSGSSGLFGKTREALLNLFLLHDSESFHLRQVARLTGCGLGGVQRELAALVTMGIITRHQSGRQVYFQADPDSPILHDLRQLLLKTSGAAGVLQSLLAPLSNDIQIALVFGSAASGKIHMESDIDLLILSDQLTMRKLGTFIRNASGRLSRDINLNLYRPEEWAERCRSGHPLIKSILDNPRIMLIGTMDELGKLAK